LEQDLYRRLTGPSQDFWLGTDTLGRDVLSRVVFGSRVALYVGILSVALGSIAGVSLGVASGYLGGWIDLSIQRTVDSFMGFPALVLALVFVAALGASVNNVILAIAVIFTPRMIRLARASTLSTKQEVYVLAAVATGCSSLRVMVRHVFPNCLAPVFVLATGYLGQAIVIEASLSFLGLGVPPPHPSWGGMLEYGARGYMETAPWLSMFPGLALASVVFAFIFFGDALRDHLDPRLRGR
jgi:peptide/nickel transport system permease protein